MPLLQTQAVDTVPEVPTRLDGKTEVMNHRIEKLKAAIAAASRNPALDGIALDLMSVAAEGASEAVWAKALEQIRRYEYYDAYRTLGIAMMP